MSRRYSGEETLKVAGRQAEKHCIVVAALNLTEEHAKSEIPGARHTTIVATRKDNGPK
jgi:hypothetical protein